VQEIRTRERIGFALHQLAADLVTERRRANALERDNRRLRSRVESLEGQLAALTAATRRPTPRQREITPSG
jgi:hypothetical protein